MGPLDEFWVRAALAGLGVAVASAPLGCFVVWRRMSYFGETTAHAAILGVALGFLLGTPLFPAVLATTLCMALVIGALTRKDRAMDTVLGVLAHGTLALGLVAVSFLDGVRVELDSFLFGDILAVTRFDLALVWAGAFLVLGLVVWRWNALLAVTLSPDLARSNGLDRRREERILTLALVLLVSLAVKVVGVLLVGGLLVIPAASARPLSRTPEAMAAGAGLVAAVSVFGGLWMSWRLDTPAGPSVICVAAGIFAVSGLLDAVRG